MKEIDAEKLYEWKKALEREIYFREKIYPSRVASGKMTKEKADHEIAVMKELHLFIEELYNEKITKLKKQLDLL